MEKVSIVINTLNRVAHLKKALASLKFLRYPQFEVVVVNGPSADDTEQLLELWKGKVKIAHCGVANLSVSRNIGIQHASGTIVAFLDDDAVPEPNWLDNLVREYDDENVGAVGGYIRNHTGVDFQCKVSICDRLGSSKDFNSYEEAIEACNTLGGDWFLSQTGANSSFRRKCLVEVGGFDEEYGYFLDETDVNLRIQQAGYELRFSPAAEVHHKYAPSSLRDKDNIPTTRYRTMRSQAYYSVKCARSGSELHAAFDSLARLSIDSKGYNRYYYEAKHVDEKTWRRLDEETEAGIEDGIRQYFSQSAPRMYQDRTIETKFKVFERELDAIDRLKICFLSQDYPPADCGGIGVWTHELATSLAKLGHEVSVVTRAATVHSTVDFEEGVWIHRIVPHWQPKRKQPMLPDIPQVTKDYAFTAYDEVMRIAQIRELDIVSAPIWDLEGIACVASGLIPTVTSLHTTFELCKPFKPEWNQNNDYEKNHVGKIIQGEKYLLKHSRFILANSESIAKEVIASNPSVDIRSKLKMVPHGITDITDAIKPVVRSDKTIRVLYVGRFEPRKGTDLLLKAIPKLLKKHDDVEFHFVGNDQLAVDGKNYRKEFEKQHSSTEWFNKVKFHGFVTNEMLHQQYADCDIFVAPSRYESFGLIFIEAMMFGKACVGTNVGGITEVIEDCGILVEPNTYELEKALDDLISNRDSRESLGDQSRQRFVDKFDSEIMAKQIKDEYDGWISIGQTSKTGEKTVGG
jgi:glycogen(starch) synthase